jgi:hypothetical protein
MFDNELFLQHCPWVHDMENGTEMVIAWVTQGKRQMESGIIDVSGKMNAIEHTIESVVDKIDDRLEEQLKPLHTILTSKVSTTKGKTGEILYENWISNEVSNCWDTECTKAQPHCGDFIHTHYDTKQKVIVDVKNYSKNVPTSEVDKLWHDMEMQCIPLGLIVSMNSRFAGRRDSMDIEFRSVHGKPATLIFLSNVFHRKELIYVALEILRLHNPKTHVDVKDVLTELQDILVILNECETSMSKMENDILNSLSVFKKTVHSHYLSVRKQLERAFS